MSYNSGRMRWNISTLHQYSLIFLTSFVFFPVPPNPTVSYHDNLNLRSNSHLVSSKLSFKYVFVLQSFVLKTLVIRENFLQNFSFKHVAFSWQPTTH